MNKAQIERIHNAISGSLKDWAKIYSEYQEKQKKYLSTPAIVRWFKNMRRPSLPCFRQTRLYEQSENPILIDLRCNNAIYVAVRDKDAGYIRRVTPSGAQEKKPVLAARGMVVSPLAEKTEKEILDFLISELSNYNVFELEEVENRQKMDSRIWK